MARSVMNVAARGPRQSRLLGTTNPDFLVSRGHARRRRRRVILTHARTVARVRARVHYYQYGRGDVRRQARGASPSRENYRLLCRE